MAVIVDFRDKIERLAPKEEILHDSYLDQDIDEQTLLSKKDEVLSGKKILQERLERIERNINYWIESFRNWLKIISFICKIAKTNDLLAKKALALEIFELNLAWRDKTLITKSEKERIKVKNAFRNGGGLWHELKNLN
jgi:hypothetical protein